MPGPKLKLHGQPQQESTNATGPVANGRCTHRLAVGAKDAEQALTLAGDVIQLRAPRRLFLLLQQGEGRERLIK